MDPFSVLASAIINSAQKVVRARQATAWSRRRDGSIVELMALLFAVARLIAGRFADASLEDEEHPGAFPSLEHGLEVLTALPPDTERATLYRYSIQALQSFEKALETPRDRGALRAPVHLPTLEHEDDILLSGKVRFWFRPCSELRELRRKRRDEFSGARGSRKKRQAREEQRRDKQFPMKPRLYPERQLTTLGAYWQANPELPPARPQNACDRALDDHILVTDSGRLAREGSFRLALCPLAGEFHPHFEIGDDGGKFRVHQPNPMAASGILEQHLDLLLEAAGRQCVDLLLLPELMVDRPRLEHLTTGLAAREEEYPRAIVPGSFHFWPDGGALPTNETRLLDNLGDELLSHRKAGRFRITPEVVHRAPQFFRCCAHVQGGGKLRGHIYEDIDRIAALQFLDTSLGRLAVVVCADGIDREESTLFDTVRAVRPDLLLIVSMSVKTEPFEELTAELARLDIGTLMVNAACVSAGEPQSLLAVADFALLDSPGMPSTRLRWSTLNAKPEVFQRRSGTWEPAQPTGASAIDWLRDGDQKLGLILDLNPHFSTPGTKES